MLQNLFCFCGFLLDSGGGDISGDIYESTSFLRGKGVWVGVRSRLWLGRGREQVVRRPPRRYRPMPLSVPALVPVPRPASTLQPGVGVGELDSAEVATAFS